MNLKLIHDLILLYVISQYIYQYKIPDPCKAETFSATVTLNKLQEVS